MWLGLVRSAISERREICVVKEGEERVKQMETSSGCKGPCLQTRGVSVSFFSLACYAFAISHRKFCWLIFLSCPFSFMVNIIGKNKSEFWC